MTENEIAVVKPYYLKEEAYQMGFDEFDGFAAEDPEEFELHYFKESARWVNVIAPELRSMAGFDDAGHGTFQVSRQVAAVKPGCEEDEPAEAELVSCRVIHSELVSAWNTGALDAATGESFDPDSVLV